MGQGWSGLRRIRIHLQQDNNKQFSFQANVYDLLTIYIIIMHKIFLHIYVQILFKFYGQIYICWESIQLYLWCWWLFLHNNILPFETFSIIVCIFFLGINTFTLKSAWIVFCLFLFISFELIFSFGILVHFLSQHINTSG